MFPHGTTALGTRIIPRASYILKLPVNGFGDFHAHASGTKWKPGNGVGMIFASCTAWPRRTRTDRRSRNNRRVNGCRSQGKRVRSVKALRFPPAFCSWARSFLFMSISRSWGQNWAGLSVPISAMQAAGTAVRTPRFQSSTRQWCSWQSLFCPSSLSFS